MLLLLSHFLAKAALKFGPPEYFRMAISDLTIIATLASKSILKGLICRDLKKRISRDIA